MPFFLRLKNIFFINTFNLFKIIKKILLHIHTCTHIERKIYSKEKVIVYRLTGILVVIYKC